MGDFTYLGRETLVRARNSIGEADAYFAEGALEEAAVCLKSLLEDCFDGGGADGPDDGAVGQLATVVDALDGDEGDLAFLREQWRDECDFDETEGKTAPSWPRFLQSYALDDLRGLVPASIALCDAGLAETGVDSNFDLAVEAIYRAITVNSLSRDEYLRAAEVAVARARDLPVSKVD